MEKKETTTGEVLMILTETKPKPKRKNAMCKGQEREAWIALVLVYLSESQECLQFRHMET